MRTRVLAIAVLAVCLGGEKPVGAEDSARDVLRRIIVSRGICVLVGDHECRLAHQLAADSELTLYVQLSTPEQVEAARRAADAAGICGTRVFVEKGSPSRIGLADNLADAVVVLGEPAAVGKEEVFRVLRPAGKGLIGKEEITKPFPPGVDDWTHHYHGPDNNTQSLDKVARAPFLTQFIAEPRYAPAPQAAVASNGRVFMAFGHIAWHEREEPWINTLIAVNGFNGTLLWKRPLASGLMIDRSTMIATPEVLYLADNKSCKLLDAATGKQIDEIAVDAEVAGGTFWKWLALSDGVLYALIGQDEDADPIARWKSTRHGWPWTGISQGYNDAKLLWGQAKTLLAVDPKTKKVLWKHQEDTPIDGRTLCMNRTRIYGSSFGKYLTCLDAKSGKVVWRKTAHDDPQVFDAIGPYRPGQGYIPGWKTAAYMKCTDKALYVVGPQVQWLTALSADDGRVLWKHDAKDLQVVIRDEGLYTIGPQKQRGHTGETQTKKLEPMTGAVLAEFATYRRACTRATGTADGIFFRAHEGSGRLDTASGKTQWISAVRPSCHVGVVVAHGHLYWLPWACDCNMQMFGAMALAPAGEFAFDQKATDQERLERPADSPHPAAEFAASPADWPTHRANNARTAETSASIPGKIARVWQYEPKRAVEPTTPVAAGGLVFVGGEDGIVRAFDAASGQPRWTAYTGGAVRYAPTIADGRALVGSADGWAYAFEAATGKLLWRFRAAPVERRIPLFGKLASTWPVAGGVLVDRGIAYFAAGINDFDGAHVYAVDTGSGKLRWQNNTCGHLDPVSSRGITCQGEMLLDQGKLYLASGNTVSPGVFDVADGRCLNDVPGSMGSGARGGRELTLTKGGVAVSGQPLYSLPEYPVYDGALKWTDPVVTAANARLSYRFREDPQGSQWVLTASDKSGAELWSQLLPGEPVRWGIAVDATGRIVVALRGGRVVCYGARP